MKKEPDLLDRIILSHRLAEQVRGLKRMFTPTQWDERMRMVRPYIEGRMKADGTEALTAAMDFAQEMIGDSQCPDLLPLLMLAGGLEIARGERK